MNLEKLKSELIVDEGVEYKIYLDSEGNYTVGIGHLVTENDPEFYYLKNIGSKTTTLSRGRVDELFKKDIAICLEDCKYCFPNFDLMTEELQLIIANMIFNLGRKRFLGFKRLIKAIKREDYKEAAKEMLDSKWSLQVKSRAKRLHKRMLALNSCSHDEFKHYK